MKTSNMLMTGFMLASLSLGVSAYAHAAAPSDTLYTNNVSTPAVDNNNVPKDKNMPKTVPSGKRHRTHTKRHAGGENVSETRPIQSGDVTPSK